MKSSRSTLPVRAFRALSAICGRPVSFGLAANILILLGLTAMAQEPGPGPAGAEVGRFIVVDVVAETGQQPLAAYQVEVTGTNRNGSVKVVGIEGGEPTAFRNAPYYDPTAMQGERVVLGAFSTAPVAQLPRGGMRIATVHYLVSGNSSPVFSAKVSAAATADGQSIPIQVNVKERNVK